MAYKLYQKLCPYGLKNNPNKDLKAINYITIHNTGNYNAGANAKSHANLQYKGNNGASWHYSVDKDEIWQSFLDNQMCWHAGDGNGKGNTESIGIEICVNDKTGFVKACDNTAQLVADLLERHNLPIDRVVQHNKWTGKNCPEKIRSEDWGVTWGNFIGKVEIYMNDDINEYVIKQGMNIRLYGRYINVDAIVKDGVTYIPTREVFESIGDTVDYNDKVDLIKVDMNMETVKINDCGDVFTLEGKNIKGTNYVSFREDRERQGKEVALKDGFMLATPKEV